MKTMILLQVVAAMMLAGTVEGAGTHDNAYLNYLKTDSAYLYSWDPGATDWVLSQVQYYSYTDGRLTQQLTRDHQTGAEVALSEYVYDSYSRRESSTNYSWDGTWIPATRYLNEYDLEDREVSLRLQKWVNGEWAEDRLQQNYIYDAQDRLIGYETIYWRNNVWTLPSVNELLYNDMGQLVSRVATRPGGDIDYRIIYEYNAAGLQQQFYTQYPADGGWSNWNLRTIQYDDCGRKAGQTNYSGEGPDWIPSTKTVLYTSFDNISYPGRKVPVCHKSHTIWVAVAAVPAHLRHGDCLGECATERERPPIMNPCPPFTVYPNPARERITIRFDQDNDCKIRRIELADNTGKLLKSYSVTDNSELTIERGKMKPGYYYIRLTGNETYGQVVVFK